MKGTITDGVNSTKRFVNKNFKDEDKQLFTDIFLGRLQIERRLYDSLRDSSPGRPQSILHDLLYKLLVPTVRGAIEDGIYKFPAYFVYSTPENVDATPSDKLQLAAVIEVLWINCLPPLPEIK